MPCNSEVFVDSPYEQIDMTEQGSPTKPSVRRYRPLVWLATAPLGFAFLYWTGSVPAISAKAETRMIAQAPTGIVIYVNPAIGSDNPTVGKAEATPFKTITFALQQAQPGTIVQLASGSYTAQTGEVFPLNLKSGVVLRGDEASKGQAVMIAGSGNFISPSFARQNVTILAGNNSEIRGVSVTNQSSRGTAVWVESTNPTIANSTFANSLREGVFVTGTANPKIIGNFFVKNQGQGVSVTKSSQGEIRGNVFQDTGFGIAIGGTSTPLVEGNQITQNQDGIYINDSARPVIRNNVISENRRDGVVATVNAQPDLGTPGSPGGNTIRSNKGFDVNNSAKGTISAVGNNIDPKRISGTVAFVAADIPTPSPTPVPSPTLPPSPGTPTPLPTPTTPVGSGFSDVRGHWAQAYIEALAAQKVITGFPDGTFQPQAPVTRAQFAAIISKAFAPAPRRAGIEFSDVAKSFWGYDAIQIVVKGGFMAGYPEGNFRPEQKIPRVQSLVAIANGLNFGDGNVALLAKYQDAKDIPSYASTAIAAATQRQVVVNYPTVTQLAPNREATRAEVAAFVYQALVNAGRVPPITSPYVVMP
jgi:parallel beta-helix repeat protein